MDNTEALESILLETLAQLEEQSHRTREALAFYSNIEHDGTRPIKIYGIALAEGDWNGVRYTSDEIKKASKSLLGLPIRVEHSRTREFKSSRVGKVTHVEWDTMLKALKFEATITDILAAKFVVNGTFKAVSVQTFVDRVPTDTIPIATNLSFVELSLVEQPACETCNIFHWESLGSQTPQTLSTGEEILEKEGNDNMPQETEELSISDLDAYLKEKYKDKYPYYPYPKKSAKAPGYGDRLKALEKRIAVIEKKLGISKGEEDEDEDKKKYPYPEKKGMDIIDDLINYLQSKVAEYTEDTDEELDEDLAKKPSEYPARGGVVCPICGPPPEGPTLYSKDELRDHVKDKHPEEYDKMKKAGKLAKAKDYFEIKEEDGKFIVYCKESGKKMGTFDSKEEAQEWINKKAEKMVAPAVKYVIKKEDDKFVVYGQIEGEDDKKIKEFDTEEEAKAFIKEKYPYPEKKSGCEDDETEEELAFPKAYTKFMKGCMKEKGDMKACYKDYIKKSKADPDKYPPLGKTQEEKALEIDLSSLESEDVKEVNVEMNEEPKIESKPEETPAEATPVVEEKPEEQPPVVESKTETPEEKPAEEPKIVETPTVEVREEPKKEVVIERIIERIVEKPPEPKTPETIVEEKPVEEAKPVEEKPVETPPVEEEPKTPEKDPLDDLSIGELIHVLYRRKEEE